MASNEQTRATAAELPGIPRVGDIVGGKYLVEGVLGRGGMGIVIAARHTTLRQRVAVKLLLPEAAQIPGLPERFVREAQAAVAIQNEHVARIIDVGTLDSGSPFMVMEYLTGTDFERIIAKQGPQPIEDAVGYILQACEAIVEAHALGVVHRDLKPGNLFLTTRSDGAPLVKVLDFGLSKAMTPDAPGAGAVVLTTNEMIAGSPGYMSPEQVRSFKNVDARTDVWAIGVILYELLTGHLPFEAASPAAILIRLSVEPPTPIRTFRQDVPPALEAIIMRCLEKDLARRIQTAAELGQALEPFGPVKARSSFDRIIRPRANVPSSPGQQMSPHAGARPPLPPAAVDSDSEGTAATVPRMDIRVSATIPMRPPLRRDGTDPLPPRRPLPQPSPAEAAATVPVAPTIPMIATISDKSAVASRNLALIVTIVVLLTITIIGTVLLFMLRSKAVPGPQGDAPSTGQAQEPQAPGASEPRGSP